MDSNGKKIAVIFGTRPDTIKQAPLIKELEREDGFFRVLTIATAQHRHMLDQVLQVFQITPDYDLNVMEQRQTLAGLTARTIRGLDEILEKENPDMVLVQGDTTTTFVGSLAAFYRKIPVGHVEAGLRTNDRANPFPEEINRRLTSCISELHFAPTDTARQCLLREGYDPKTVFVTGNTVIDALQYSVRDGYRFSTDGLNEIAGSSGRLVLVTMHRRENWGEPMKGACRAIRTLAERYRDMSFVFPVHLNPVVRDIVNPMLGGLPNIHLIEPLDYLDFVNIMSRSHLILTDSGGVQEEGPHFGIPILVLRQVTERPEAVQYGTVALVGADEKRILDSATRLLEDQREYQRMATAVNPYGDGRAAKRTVHIIKNYFGFSSEPFEEFIPS
ncbi:MAG: UDP-N-acetylglucosamine 2-epimerase (non-hydrolyzing) [Spirochaetes bacterium]|nr:UDP-N-acetylglucosamine 2-epimerase (non-hydrolyzing) [Spirochaetota bacterium]